MSTNDDLESQKMLNEINQTLSDFRDSMKDEIHKHRAYAHEHGTDAPEINNWRWTFGHGACNG